MYTSIILKDLQILGINRYNKLCSYVPTASFDLLGLQSMLLYTVCL